MQERNLGKDISSAPLWICDHSDFPFVQETWIAERDESGAFWYLGSQSSVQGICD